jgi:hypothetical protein
MKIFCMTCNQFILTRLARNLDSKFTYNSQAVQVSRAWIEGFSFWDMSHFWFILTGMCVILMSLGVNNY